MGGLEKITEHLINNAKKEAEEIINSAKEKADEIQRNFESKKNELILENNKKIESETRKIMDMAQSAAKQSKRQAMLETRNNVIKSIINDAKSRIINLPQKEYLDILKTILKNSQTGEKGEILFSKSDTKLIDKDFLSEIEQISNGLLEISKETAPIENGFIIRYGKIEQNCSIQSIIEDKYNELTDLVNECIFEN